MALKPVIPTATLSISDLTMTDLPNAEKTKAHLEKVRCWRRNAQHHRLSDMLSKAVDESGEVPHGNIHPTVIKNKNRRDEQK